MFLFFKIKSYTNALTKPQGYSSSPSGSGFAPPPGMT